MGIEKMGGGVDLWYGKPRHCGNTKLGMGAVFSTGKGNAGREARWEWELDWFLTGRERPSMGGGGGISAGKKKTGVCG